MTVEGQRAAVVKEALEWLRTPYMDNARVKGLNGGCDCLTFIAGVYENAGIIPHLPIPKYPPDWHLNSDLELYMIGKDDTPGVLSFCVEIEGPPHPGDLVFYKFGHCYAHSAIVLDWPHLIIHAWRRKGVGRDDPIRHSILNRIHESIPQRGQPRPKKFFTLKGWANG